MYAYLICMGCERMAEDVRVVKTRRDIEGAFLHLLEQRPFQKITVQMICREAMVNKGTFYRHYNDKYDLASQIARSMVMQLNACVDQNFRRVAAGGAPVMGSRAVLEVLQDLLPNLALLEGIGLPDVNLHLSVMRVISQDLRAYTPGGYPQKDADTEAWVIAHLMLAYPQYVRDMDDPMDLYDYIRSVHEASSAFLPWLRTQKPVPPAVPQQGGCILPTARPSLKKPKASVGL